MVLSVWVLEHEIDVEFLLDHVVDFDELLVGDVVDLFGKVGDHFGHSALELVEFTLRQHLKSSELVLVRWYGLYG